MFILLDLCDTMTGKVNNDGGDSQLNCFNRVINRISLTGNLVSV